MSTFKVNHRTDPLHGQTLTEHPTIARYDGGSVKWVCLITGERQSKWYALSNLQEVKHPNDSGLDYCYPQPCTAIVVFRPTIEVPITELGFYREGSKQPAIPGLLLHKSNVRIVLTMPEAA